MPAKTEEAKEMDRFYAGAEEDVDARLERRRLCARPPSFTSAWFSQTMTLKTTCECLEYS